MKIRTCAALLLAVGLPTAVFAVDFPEVEPNETKAQALTNGVITLAAGDSVSGTTTGTSTTIAGAASADTFLIKTTPAALGIYRHRMVITTTGTAGHIGTIRGLASTSTGATAGGDSTLQTSASTTTPARFNQWYGFGKGEQLYYRVTGTATTTAGYISTLSTDVVVPTVFGTAAEAGTMTIFHDAATNTAYDRDMFLFDSNFNPISGIDDSDTTVLTANLTPGTYYIGYGRFNTAAGSTAGSGVIQGTFQTGAVLDFNDLVTTSSSVNGTQPVGLNITHVAGVSNAVGPALAPYDVAWFSFTVNPAVSPTNPTGTGLATPASVLNDGTGVTTLRVTVTPGANPTSTFLTTGSVTVDGAGIGAGTVTLLDNGVAPDLVAGDLIFSANATVANGTPGAAYTLPFTITDDQARVGTGNIALTVTTAPPACAAGLATLTFNGVSSNGAIGDVGNSIVTGDFGVAGSVNTLTITGRYTALLASWRSEARIRAIAPDGSIYDTAAFAGAPGSAGTWDVLGTVLNLGGLEAGTGTWSFEFWESFNDTGQNPDATWQSVCFAANLTSTNPTATGVATPNNAVNDGTGVTTLSITVTPGAEPLSTFLTTGSVTVNGAGIGAGTITLLDNGVAPDAVAGDNIFTANAAVANGTPAGSTPLPYSVIDDQGRSASGNIAFTVTTPPPGCPAGLATLSFTNAQGDGAVGDIDNSIVSGNFSVAGNINTIRMSGRMNSNALFNAEARVLATAPDGTQYALQPFPTGTSVTPRDLATIDFILVGLEAGTGTWSFEFFESFNDTATPDVVWSNVCFSVDQTSIPLTVVTDAATSPVVRDGVATSTLTVTVAPAAFPSSTGVAVVVDDTSVGGSGSLTLLDDGNAPDLVAGDNVFTGTTTVAYTTALGTATLPFTVTDNEGGNATGSLNFTVAEATGACCLGDGTCVVTTIGDCLDVQFGTFAGTGTLCVGPTVLATDGAGAFEDISATGSLVTFGLTDDSVAAVTLPFTFNFFGTDYTSGNVSTNGNFQFGTNNSTAFANGPIPSAAVPNNALYVLWDDLNLLGGGTVRTELLGTIGVDARFIIQWNAGQYNGTVAPTDLSVFQIALFEDGSFEYRYQSVSGEAGTAGTGDTTTIGFENSTGTIAHQSAQTRATLGAAAPISFRANSTLNDTGVCAPTCAPCAADYDNNGGVDGGDLAAFFNDFEQGLGCADVDQNGGVDGGDLAFFFSVFEAGGC